MLYERAKIFVEQFSRIDSTAVRQHDGEVASNNVSKEVEAFSLPLINILISPKTNGAEPESTRMKRAALAVAYANSAPPSETGRLTSILELWLDEERSGPIRDSLQRALLTLRQNG